MNKRSLSLLACSALLLLAACKKEDLQQEHSTALETAAATAPAAKQWKEGSEWKALSQANTSLYYTTLSDSTITEAVVKQGVVLVYEKTSSAAVRALPFTVEQGGQRTSWYYQVSEGQVRLFCEAATRSAAAPAAESFQYFVLSADKLKNLQQQGHSKESLLALPFEQAEKLLQ